MEKSINTYHNVMRVPKCLRHVKGFDYLGEPWFRARTRVWYSTDEIVVRDQTQSAAEAESKRRDKTAWKTT